MNTIKKPRGRPKNRTFSAEGVMASPYFDQYLNQNTFEQTPMTEAGIERFARDLVNWARTDEKALIITDFPQNIGITRSVFYAWIKRSPELANAVLHARHLIASRRENGLFDRRYDMKSIAVRQYQLDSEWDEAEQRQVKLKMEQLEHQVRQLQVYVDMSKPQVISGEAFKKEVEGTKE